MAGIFLGSSVVIWLVESPPERQQEAKTRLGEVAEGEPHYVVSDLVRLECRAKPPATGDERLLRDFDLFLASPPVACVALSASVCDRAATIRATYGYRTADALHLAAAIEAECEAFVTGDARLARFSGTPVRLLRMAWPVAAPLPRRGRYRLNPTAGSCTRAGR